jgi:leucyl-tRNA synthetase
MSEATAAAPSYDPVAVQARWQARWAADRLDEVDTATLPRERKFYNLVEFPYPSAEGLHVGHAYSYCGADVYGRWLRMRGRTVFQPIGFDSFGIHTENYALRVGQHPAPLTARTIARYREQLMRIGAAWDWGHQLSTSDPAYYRWTQWLFLRLYRAGLAVRREASVVWCPSCLTVLAQEQLEGDRCERCNSQVTTRVTRQWFLRITAYADRLVDGLDELDWPETAKRSQREWIGRSEGVEVDFEVRGGELLTAFTTRPDTLFGATFLAVSVQHPRVEELARAGGNQAEVAAFVASAREQAARASAAEAYGGRGTPRALRTGATAIHPATGAELPICVADYVDPDHGTGAVMGVPAHDERDWEVAAELGVPVVEVVVPADPAERPPGPWTGPGQLVRSGRFSGMASQPGGEAITRWLEERGSGRRATAYRLHDWLISRQRYWGPPIPVVYCDACGTVPVPEDQLPVLLPEVRDVRPTGTGVSPLASAASFVETTCPGCGGPARRETDVSDTFFDSSWYFLRYPSTDLDDVPWSPERTARMLPVDLYLGGPEHVNRHHLYARFVTMALHEAGLLPFAEPFPRLRLHGLLLKDGRKISKSRGNVIDPDAYVARVGADTLRMYLLFLGPWEVGGDFSDAGLAGIQRFSARAWRLITEPHVPGAAGGGSGGLKSEAPTHAAGDRLEPSGSPPVNQASGGLKSEAPTHAAGERLEPSGSPPVNRPGVDLRPLDRAVAAVERDLARLKFNTALATLMELVRWARQERAAMAAEEWELVARTLVLLLAPFAPHLAEELWSHLGGPYPVHRQPWPSHDPAALDEQRINLVVQVNGKRRDVVPAPAGIGREEALALAMESERVRRQLAGRTPRRTVYVPDRLVNLVV